MKKEAGKGKSPILSKKSEDAVVAEKAAEFGFPADFVKENPFISKSISKFIEAETDYVRLEIICELQRSMKIIRYDNDKIYDQDDPTLLPERRWLYTPMEKIENQRKQLYDNLYGDLEE